MAVFLCNLGYGLIFDSIFLGLKILVSYLAKWIIMPSAIDAEETLRATERKENFLVLSRLLMCGGVRLLREKFDSMHSPSKLPSRLSDPATRNKLNRARLPAPQRKCLYPSPGTFGKSTDFDITLLFILFRKICNLTEPSTAWKNPPNSTDHSLQADLVRIKNYRNSVRTPAKWKLRTMSSALFGAKSVRLFYELLDLWVMLSEMNGKRPLMGC